MTSNDEHIEKMKKRESSRGPVPSPDYAAMAVAEAAFADVLAHAFEGEEPMCTSCKRGRRHPFHLCSRCTVDVELDHEGVCPRCGLRV